MEDEDPRGPRPRYKWKLTWPDELQDHFTGYDGIHKIGLFHVHHQGYWLWYLNLHGPGFPTLCPATGTADTARLAAKALEDCYDRQLAGTWPGMTEEVRNKVMALADRLGRQAS